MLRKLSGKRTHIANLTTLAGTGLMAAGVGVDPVQLAAAATGSVDAINGIVQAWDAGRAVNWTQVGLGGALALVGPVFSSVARELATRPGALAKR